MKPSSREGRPRKRGQQLDLGYSSLSKAFKGNPTLANYIKLRRDNPEATIEVAITGGLDWFSAHEDMFKRFHIPADIVLGVLDADLKAISELSLLLMERLIARERSTKAGASALARRGEAISNGQVNQLINVMLDSLDWNNALSLPRDLIVLIRHQTGGVHEWKREKKHEDSHGSCTRAICAAIEIAVTGKEPSFRSVGAAIGVDPTTVMRWISSSALEAH